MADGLANKPDWHMYHKKLPMKHVPLARDLHDKLVPKEASEFMEKEKWETAFILLGR